MPTTQTIKRWTLSVLAVALVVGTFAQAADSVLQGQWTKKAYASSGSWRIEPQGEGFVLVLDPSFATKKAPDLKLFLHRSVPSAVDAKNVTEGVLIGKLDRYSGEVRFAIPSTIDLSEYRTLAIHCEEYSKLWSVAALQSK